MYEYKSEILETKFKLSPTNLDELANKRALEGWELVAYSFFGNNYVMLVTFKKEK